MRKGGYVMSNGFILETFDEDLNMKVQFHYWIEGEKFYSSTELENGTTAWKGQISEDVFVGALEEFYNV